MSTLSRSQIKEIKKESIRNIAKILVVKKVITMLCPVCKSKNLTQSSRNSNMNEFIRYRYPIYLFTSTAVNIVNYYYT